jgi:lycopene cyclase domain-containing protein
VYLYLYINLAIIAFPLVISFERKRVNYQSRMKSVTLSILIVSAAFIAWDALATSRGHWSFNSAYLIGPNLLGLPFEEILFFITVPFSCLFTYHALEYFSKDKKLIPLGKLPVAVGAGILLLSLAFVHSEYTFLAILSAGISVLVAHKLVKDMFSSRLYWLYIAVTLAFFFAFNYFLTSLPIVEYSSVAISGLRVTTIPVEDFLFNFSMLTLYLAVHLSASRKFEAG